MINYIEGDLVTIKHGIFAHQSNILGLAGSGIVTDIKDNFPGWYLAYKDFCNYVHNKFELLGQVQFYAIPETSAYIANLFSQFSVKPFSRNTDLKALETALTNVHNQAKINALPVYIPFKIASVRGGMDWDVEVLPIIEKIFSNSDVQLFIVHYVKDKQI